MSTIDTLPPQKNLGLPHPQILSAEKLKKLLLALAKKPEYAAHKSTLRSAAYRVREQAFGYNRDATKRKILKLLAAYECLELDDLTDETGIPAGEIGAALNELIDEGKVERSRRRRWQEPGKHYNPIFRIVS